MHIMNIKAVCLDDMTVMSSLLQDSIFNPMFMHYEANKNELHMLVNRFCWEAGPAIGDERKNEKIYSRSYCGVHIPNVAKVRTNRRIQPTHYPSIFSLLTISFDRGKMRFIFSGGFELVVNCDTPSIYLADAHEPWPTKKIPRHHHNT
jgi:hypothetical protein